STLAVPAFADGAAHACKIRYQSGVMSVFIDNLVQPVIGVNVNLGQLLSLDQGRAWVGFTAATGSGVPQAHEILDWHFVESPPPSGNLSPFPPTITEPATNGQIVNPADVHMETGAFVDSDVGDQHRCTDWEIWTVSPSQRVWASSCAGGVEKLHTHLGDGVFENSHAGRSELFALTNFSLRVRHSDDSGDPSTEWSAWSARTFHTGSVTTAFPLEIEDVATAPSPQWRFLANGSPVILQPAGTPAELLLETGTSALVLSIQPNDGVTNTWNNPAALTAHEAMRVQLRGGSLGLSQAASRLVVVDEDCATHEIMLPAVTIPPGGSNYYWIASSGASYVGSAVQTTPVFSVLAQGLTPPWIPRADNFKVEIVAGGFQLPVNIAFVPNAGPNPSDPFFYVSELYGQIKVVSRDRTVSTYASGLLDFNPTGAFPGSGEQGLTGLVVDPLTGDVYASMLRAQVGNQNVHFPKIDRFTSNDGGRTAANRITILDMPNEEQGQSHQISNLTIAPDGKLICHMGDGFSTPTAQNLDSFRGKILRLNLNGTAASDNPFYDSANGISARDYVFAFGVRNPFAGDWRAADASQYVVENGPSVDRFARIIPGRNYLWDGSDQSMSNFALYNWNPAHGPVNLVFVQPSVFGGSGFPSSSQGHAFVSESGPTYATGLQTLGKRITEWILDANGNLVAGPIPFLEYAGTGKATACALEAGPDGLYMSELYYDLGNNATQAGARILRIGYETPADCNGNGIDDVCDLAHGTSADANANSIPDECDCSGAAYCTAKSNSLGCVPTIAASGSATVGAPDNFVIQASNVLNKKPGIMIWSNGAAAVPFGGGTLCLQAPIHRLSGLDSGGSPAGLDCTGVFTQAISDAFLQNNGVSAGMTLHFQIWSRDPGFAPPNSIGLSDALRVFICP
ncbi:MAG: PQQ-dependent sugar dehydrogenase, partial [Planctomycetota bacterium]